MKILSSIITCSTGLFLLISCAGKKTKEQSPTLKVPAVQEVAQPVLTDRHVNMPNSHLYVIPPKGFTINKTSGTLAKADGYAHLLVMIIIAGIDPSTFFADIKAECDKHIAGAWEQEELTVNGRKATAYLFKMGGVYQRYLRFSGGDADEMLVANYEESEAAEGMALYNAMKTVVVKN